MVDSLLGAGNTKMNKAQSLFSICSDYMEVNVAYLDPGSQSEMEISVQDLLCEGALGINTHGKAGRREVELQRVPGLK